jgi:hypothetical protein
MLELERRRLDLGWPMWQVDERAGLQDGYYAKLLWTDTKSGRQAGWEVLQWVMEALGPAGFDFEIHWQSAPMLCAQSMRRAVHAAVVHFDTTAQRKHMRELSSRSRKTKHLSPEQRSRIARKAARARWRELEKIRIKRWVRGENSKAAETSSS